MSWTASPAHVLAGLRSDSLPSFEATAELRWSDVAPNVHTKHRPSNGSIQYGDTGFDICRCGGPAFQGKRLNQI